MLTWSVVLRFGSVGGHPELASRQHPGRGTTLKIHDGRDNLVADAAGDNVAVMCSESLGWRCHRRLIADGAVLLRGIEVWHLFHDTRVQARPPTPAARVDPSGILIYDIGTTPALPS